MQNFTVSLAEAKKLIIPALKARIVPILESSPGIGKSALFKEIAEELELLLLDERLSTMEPTDLNGYPSIYETDWIDAQGATHKLKKAGFIPFENWPLEDAVLPINPKTGNPYKGWLLFLDEIRSATPTTQAAAYRVLLDREIGKRKLHPRCLVAAASNRLEDNAVVYDAGTAFQSRALWIEVHSDLIGWRDNFALIKGIDQRVLGFLNWKGQTALNNFRADHDEKNFACERTWETLSKYISKLPAGPIPMEYLPALVGIVGQSTAIEFQSYTNVYQNLLSFAQIIAAPTTVHIDMNRPDIIWATVSSITVQVDANNVMQVAQPIMQFANRLPVEYQAMIIKSLTKANPAVMAMVPAVATWLSQKSGYLSHGSQAVPAQPMPTSAAAPAPVDQDDDF